MVTLRNCFFRSISGNRRNEYDNDLLGSLVWGLFVAYIFVKWAHISTWQTGLQAGAVIGLFLGLYWNFFYNTMKATADINWQTVGLDIVLTVVTTALCGLAIAVVVGKMK